MRGVIALLLMVLVACSLLSSSLPLLAEARPQHDTSTPEERHAARHAGRNHDNEVSADAAAPVEGSPARKVEVAAPPPSLKDLAGSNSGGGGGGGDGKVKAKSSFSSSSSSSSSPKAAMKCAPDSKNGDKLSNSPLGYAASQLANAPCARAASGIPDAAAAAAATPRKEPRGGVAGDVATAGLSESVEPQSLSEADRYFEDDDGSIAHPVAPVGEALGGSGGGKRGSSSSEQHRPASTSSTSISQQQGQNQQQQQQQQPHHPPHHHHRGGAAHASENEGGSEGQQQSAVDELAGAAARALSGNGNGNANLPASASNAFQPRALPSQQPLGGSNPVADAVGGRAGGPSGDPLGDLSRMLEQASKLEQEVAGSPLGEALPKLAEAVPQAAQTMQAAGQALTPVANDIAVGLANNLPALLPSIGALLGKRRRLAQVAPTPVAPAPSPASAAATPLATSPLAALAARIGAALGLLPPPADDAQQPRPAQQAASFFP